MIDLDSLRSLFIYLLIPLFHLVHLQKFFFIFFCFATEKTQTLFRIFLRYYFGCFHLTLSDPAYTLKSSKNWFLVSIVLLWIPFTFQKSFIYELFCFVCVIFAFFSPRAGSFFSHFIITCVVYVLFFYFFFFVFVIFIDYTYSCYIVYVQ